MKRTLKLRQDQSSPLTMSEMDDNLLYLKELAESSSNETSEQQVEVYLPLLGSVNYGNLLLGKVILSVKGLYNKDDEGDYERISFSGLVKLDEVFEFYNFNDFNDGSGILENLENDFYLPVNYTLIKKDESDVYISINSTLIDYEYYYDGNIHEISYKILNEKFYEKYDNEANSLKYSKRGYIDSTYEINLEQFPDNVDSEESFNPVGGDNYGKLYVTKKMTSGNTIFPDYYFFELVIKNKFDKTGLGNIDLQASSIIVTKNSSLGVVNFSESTMPIYSYNGGVIFIRDAENLIINIKGRLPATSATPIIS
jgi:hypothetical protein